MYENDAIENRADEEIGPDAARSSAAVAQLVPGQGGQLSSGVVEGFNTKAKLTSRKPFGFRTYRGAEIALYHALGALPEPEFTHRFC